MSQVRFIAMCEHGHVQDFPWREWVHGQCEPNCQENLRLISIGSASLAGQKVRCDCGKERNLSGITTAYNNGSTFLSKHLSANGELFPCQGKKPWLGEAASETCSAQLRGSLRGASNLYFAQVESSLYIPISEDSSLQELEAIFQNHPVSTFLSTMKDLGISSIEKISQGLRSNYTRLLMDYSDTQIHSALENTLKQEASGSADSREDHNTGFRQAEYSVLRMERDDEFLKIKKADLNEYRNNLINYFSRIMLVSKMCETRVLAGFTRVYAENDQSRDHRQAMLWKEMPSSERWLPAYRVFGEGLFFEFSEQRLHGWEMRRDILARVLPLKKRNAQVLQKRHLRAKEISARFVLLHTFAHLLMNRLTFECGYSSAALRERLYVSTNPGLPMNGVLIYTADGDSEGTMGGLVRMGKPGNLENVILRAIENAKWCSADPVCMELGSSNGQGPDSCNLAACHNCALVPETACEEFNHFLDRGLVIGDFERTTVGYFDF